MFIIRHKNIFIDIGVLLMLASFVAIFVWGLRFGIDFTGGSLVEVEYGTAAKIPEISEVKTALAQTGEKGAEAVVQPTGEKGYIIRTAHLSSEEHTALLAALGENGRWMVDEKRFDSVGPAVGDELRKKAFVALGAVILAIVIFVAFAFRKVSRPVPSWQYGVITLIALVHDVIVPTGIAAYLGHAYGMQIDILFVTALLTVLGFSVHDTIVVFDRIRENLALKKYETFSETVGKSMEQTFLRSINTSLTVVLALAALLFFGPASVFSFSLILLIGIIAGTYSSIFLASPLLLAAERLIARKENQKNKEIKK